MHLNRESLVDAGLRWKDRRAMIKETSGVHEGESASLPSEAPRKVDFLMRHWA
jgi:hypothetical protein